MWHHGSLILPLDTEPKQDGDVDLRYAEAIAEEYPEQQHLIKWLSALAESVTGERIIRHLHSL